MNLSTLIPAHMRPGHPLFSVHANYHGPGHGQTQGQAHQQAVAMGQHSANHVNLGQLPGSSRQHHHGFPEPRHPQMLMPIPNEMESGMSSMERKRKGTPYIPSYMDLSNGPEPCVVCGDAATGYHYRCMTCEGCKGFFRRTIQKNLKYHCKWNGNCVIDKTTRNQCQECRFKKCVAIGMATDLVLNEKQRVAKRKLIEDNRERRRVDTVQLKTKHDSCYHDIMTDEDRALVSDIIEAYEQTAMPKTYSVPDIEDHHEKLEQTNPAVWQHLTEIMTPSIVKVVAFAKAVPGFINLNVDDQILLLKSCCMEIMCLRAACRYNPETKVLTLQSGLSITREQLGGGGVALLIEPIFDFAQSLSKLNLDSTEIALLAAVLLMQSDRTGLRESESVEHLQDGILGAYKRYIAEERPHQPVHWAKILMKVTDLRTISTRHAERVLCIKLDAPSDIPSLFLEMFDEDGASSRRNSATGSLSRKSSLSDSVFGSFSDLTMIGDRDRLDSFSLIRRDSGKWNPLSAGWRRDSGMNVSSFFEATAGKSSSNEYNRERELETPPSLHDRNSPSAQNYFKSLSQNGRSPSPKPPLPQNSGLMYSSSSRPFSSFSTRMPDDIQPIPRNMGGIDDQCTRLGLIEAQRQRYSPLPLGLNAAQCRPHSISPSPLTIVCESPVLSEQGRPVSDGNSHYSPSPVHTGPLSDRSHERHSPVPSSQGYSPVPHDLGRYAPASASRSQEKTNSICITPQSHANIRQGQYSPTPLNYSGNLRQQSSNPQRMTPSPVQNQNSYHLHPMDHQHQNVNGLESSMAIQENNNMTKNENKAIVTSQTSQNHAPSMAERQDVMFDKSYQAMRAQMIKRAYSNEDPHISKVPKLETQRSESVQQTITLDE